MTKQNENNNIEDVGQTKSLFSQLPWYYTVSGLIIAPLSSIFLRIIHTNYPINTAYIHLSDISIVFLVLLFIGSNYIKWLKQHNVTIHFTFLTGITVYAWNAFNSSSMQTGDYLLFVTLFFICNTFFSRHQYYLFYALIVLTLLGFSYVKHQEERGILSFVLLGVFYCGVGNMIAFYFRSRIIDKHKKHSNYLSKLLGHPGIGYALLYITENQTIQIKDDNTSIYPLLSINTKNELIELITKQLDRRKINTLKQNQEQILFIENNNRFFEFHIDAIQQIETNHFLLRVFDVTEERKAERISNERQQKYKMLLEKNVAGVFSLDENGKIVELNDTLRFLLLNNGLSDREIHDAFAYCDTRWTDFKNQLNSNQPNSLHNLSFRLPYNTVYLLVRIQFEELTQLYEGTAIDVSEIEQVKREKEEKDEHYQLIFQESNDAIIHSQNGIILSANKSAMDLSGLSENELLGKGVWDFFITNLDKETVQNNYTIKKKFFLEGIWLGTTSSVPAEVSVNSYTQNKVVFEQSIIRDIGARKKYEESLVKTQIALQNILDNIPESVFVLKENDIVFTNKQAKNSFPFEDKSIDRLFATNKQLIREMQLFMGTKETRIGQLELNPGSIIQFTITSTLYFDENHTLLVLKDVTPIIKLQNEQARADLAEKMSQELALEIENRKKTEQVLESQTARLSTIIESASNTLIWMVDKNNKLISYNSHFKNLLLRFLPKEFDFKEGIDLTQALSYGMTKTGIAETKEILKKTEKGKPNQTEGIIIVDGKYHWFETFINPIMDAQGELKEVSFVAHDVTEKRLKNKELVNSLHEKEILLKEVHHRVKNNLQVISSILNLQSSYVSDEKTLTLLKESQNRIKSMSFIHENLYQTKDFSAINFSDYLQNISQNLFQSHKVYSNHIKLKTTIQHNHLDLDKAIPCGLIVNELLSNALKYAFDENQTGEIHVSFVKKGKTIVLELGDNGKGMPSGFNIENAETLGLQLVSALVEQLNGKMELKTERGTNYLITFES